MQDVPDVLDPVLSGSRGAGLEVTGHVTLCGESEGTGIVTLLRHFAIQCLQDRGGGGVRGEGGRAEGGRGGRREGGGGRGRREGEGRIRYWYC